MPINATFDTQDAVPDFLKTAVVEKDGKWIFEAETVAEVGNLKSSLKKERDNRTKFEAEVKKFERFKPFAEADEEEVTQFVEAWSKRGEKKEDKDKPGEDSIKLKEQLEKAHQKQLQAKEAAIAKAEAELTTVKGQLREVNLWTPLRELFIKANGDPSDWEVARLELANQKRFDFDDEGKIVVMDDGHSSTVTPDKFFKDVYSEARPKFYKASNAAGSGAQNNTSGNGNRSISISREQAKDPMAYRAAKERAAKAGTELQIND
jgi:hypothetical protein